MQNLRIVGVETAGKDPQLLLSDEAGAEYALPIDQALKSAASQAGTPGAQRAAESEAGGFSPREIQARLRAGATVEQVVDASGHSQQHVLRYAGPVADERAFYAGRARATVVARASTAENHRLAFGDAAATLEDMVKVRLRAMGVHLDSLTWDAWRGEDGLWTVVTDFDATTSETHAEAIGQQPPAEWVYDPSAKQVRAANKWAESLISLPPAAGKQRGGRRLAAVEEPFDVDDQGSDTAAVRSGPPAVEGSGSAGRDGADHEDLLDILRARRGQRLGSDQTGDEKLATLLTRDEQPEQQPPSLQAVDDSVANSGDPEPAENDAAETDAWGFSYSDAGEDEAAETDSQAPAPQQKPGRKKKTSSRRPTMPRWDDILFGSKNE